MGNLPCLPDPMIQALHRPVVVVDEAPKGSSMRVLDYLLVDALLQRLGEGGNCHATDAELLAHFYAFMERHCPSPEATRTCMHVFGRYLDWKGIDRPASLETGPRPTEIERLLLEARRFFGELSRRATREPSVIKALGGKASNKTKPLVVRASLRKRMVKDGIKVSVTFEVVNAEVD